MLSINTILTQLFASWYQWYALNQTLHYLFDIEFEFNMIDLEKELELLIDLGVS
jgi:hypothetical protein